MGEARRRGTLEARVEAARARDDAKRPAFIVCNGCKAELRNVSSVAIPSLRGLDAAFVAHCDPCDADTFGAVGTPEALRQFAELLRSNTASDDLVGARYGRVKEPGEPGSGSK